MNSNVVTVTANGIGSFDAYLTVLHKHVDELAIHGMGYEEQDRREPLTAALVVSIVVTTAITATVSEIIKMMIKELCEVKEKKTTAETISVTINMVTYHLPRDRVRILEKVETLTGP